MNKIYIAKNNEIIKYNVFLEENKTLESINNIKINSLSEVEETLFINTLKNVLNGKLNTLSILGNNRLMNDYIKEYQKSKKAFYNYAMENYYNCIQIYLGNLLEYTNNKECKDIITKFLNTIIFDKQRVLKKDQIKKDIKDFIRINNLEDMKVLLYNEVEKSYQETYQNALENKQVLKLTKQNF